MHFALLYHIPFSGIGFGGTGGAGYEFEGTSSIFGGSGITTTCGDGFTITGFAITGAGFLTIDLTYLGSSGLSTGNFF